LTRRRDPSYRHIDDYPKETISMADITRYPFTRHLRGTATVHVQHVRHGKVRHSGTGLSFWFRPLSAVLSEVPVADRELPMLFHARTSDFQDVTVQATVTYRIADPDLASSRIDFSVDPDTGAWRTMPLEQVAGLLTEIVQQQSLALLAAMPLTAALVTGVDALRSTVGPAIAADVRLSETGISIVALRVVAIRPEPDVEKALRTPAREQVQQEADRATYERRAVAVERERAISENELQSKIELARREEQLVAQHGANARREAEEQAAAGQIAAEAMARRTLTLAEGEASATRARGEAEAAAESAHLAARRDLPDQVLWTEALRELSGRLPDIDSLVLTPDLLTPLLARLGASSSS
jgi:regulator of protease activity HflC (stomatin/prohibitin superfamily)